MSIQSTSTGMSNLATISGKAPLPLINYLGYHFCKWDWVSADLMRERNANFTKFDIPQKWETKAATKAGLIPEDFDAKASLKTRANYASKGKHPTFVRIFVPKPADSDNFAGEIKGALRGLKLIK